MFEEVQAAFAGDRDTGVVWQPPACVYFGSCAATSPTGRESGERGSLAGCRVLEGCGVHASGAAFSSSRGKKGSSM
jgi:hypothetical protein